MTHSDEQKFRKWIRDFVAGLRDHGVPRRWIVEETRQAIREYHFAQWREYFKSRA